MELKIWVEGIQRIVCGVTVNTTCQEVVFALANATGKVGRFTLIERWRNNERLLAPTENPLKLLLKWGEYASDVQFILQRSEQVNRAATATSDEKQTTKKQPLASSSSDLKPHQQQQQQQPMQLQQQQNNPKHADTNYTSLNQCKELRKSFGSQAAKSIDNVGIFPGVKQQNIPSQQPIPTIPQQSVKHEKSTSNVSMPSLPSASDTIFNFFAENPSIEINPKKPLISSNGALVPPPYRDPPPPRNSPMQLQQQTQSSRLLKYTNDVGNNALRTNSIPSMDFNENSFQTAQYKDLRQLIKFQRDKITSQQSELTKYDAEIVDLENKERDQAQDLEAISREITKSDHIFRQGSEQLQTLQYVVEDNELVKQQGKTLKSEIKLLRSKLANCETELLQCKNKMRILMDDIQAEHKAISIQQMDDRQNVKRDFLIEMERIQIEIDQAIHATDSSSLAIDHLKKEINMIENAIADKKRQVEQLVNEMKEVNLQSLAVKPSDEICSLLEGSTKTGSSRRIIGSPRQLENAVPTKKNPHGVWV